MPVHLLVRLVGDDWVVLRVNCSVSVYHLLVPDVIYRCFRRRLFCPDLRVNFFFWGPQFHVVGLSCVSLVGNLKGFRQIRFVNTDHRACNLVLVLHTRAIIERLWPPLLSWLIMNFWVLFHHNHICLMVIVCLPKVIDVLVFVVDYEIVKLDREHLYFLLWAFLRRLLDILRSALYRIIITWNNGTVLLLDLDMIVCWKNSLRNNFGSLSIRFILGLALSWFSGLLKLIFGGYWALNKFLVEGFGLTLDLFCSLLCIDFPHWALHLINLILNLIRCRHCPRFGCTFFVTFRFVYFLSLEWLRFCLNRVPYRVCHWLLLVRFFNLNGLAMRSSNYRNHLLDFGWVHDWRYLDGLLILTANTGCRVFDCLVYLLVLGIFLLQLLNLYH